MRNWKFYTFLSAVLAVYVYGAAVSYDTATKNTSPTNVNYRGQSLRLANGTTPALITLPYGANYTNASTAVAVTNDIDWHFRSNAVFSGTVSLPNSGVTGGTYGDASNIPQIVIGADGRITSATDIPVSGGSSVIFQSGASVTVSNTATETALFTNNTAIVSGAMGTDKSVFLHMIGEYVNNSGGSSNLTFNVYVGTTKVYGDGTANFSTSATVGTWDVKIRVGNLDSASSQLMLGTVLFGNRGSTTAGLGDLTGTSYSTVGVIAGTSAFDTSAAALPLSVTITPQHAVATIWVTRMYCTLMLE